MRNLRGCASRLSADLIHSASETAVGSEDDRVLAREILFDRLKFSPEANAHRFATHHEKHSVSDLLSFL